MPSSLFGDALAPSARRKLGTRKRKQHICKELAIKTRALQGRARRRRTSSLVTAMGMLKRRARSFFFSSSAARSACAPRAAALTGWKLVGYTVPVSHNCCTSATWVALVWEYTQWFSALVQCTGSVPAQWSQNRAKTSQARIPYASEHRRVRRRASVRAGLLMPGLAFSADASPAGLASAAAPALPVAPGAVFALAAGLRATRDQARIHRPVNRQVGRSQ